MWVGLPCFQNKIWIQLWLSVLMCLSHESLRREVGFFLLPNSTGGSGPVSACLPKAAQETYHCLHIILSSPLTLFVRQAFVWLGI